MGGGGSRARQQVGAAKISVPAVGDVPQDAGWSQPLQISTTPRRESIEEREGMRECVAETPKTSEGRRDFPCFCPLCMCWYKAALITRCCAHHICLPCWNEYLSTKLEGDREVRTILCPHCQQEDIQLGSVDQSSGDVRNYLTTPMSQRPQFIAQSPVRVGDSTENLVRKLMPFTTTTNPESSQFSAGSFVSNTIEQAVSRIIARSNLHKH